MSIRIRVTNPDISDLETTKISADVSSGTDIVVDSVSGFSANDYVIVGEHGSDSAELKQISSISGLTVTIDSAISNSHVAGESVTKILYDKVKIYRASSSGGTFSVIATVDVDVSNHNKETVYVDTSGDSTKYYKTSFYNTETITESSLSDEIQGDNLLSYISLSEFRTRTGITASDISDSLLTTYLNRAAKKISDECYILRRREKISKTTDTGGTERYYFNLLYLADKNLDGSITKDDLEVLEANSDGTVENDITSQVASINQYRGYFTLNDGYPTDDSYGIYVTYEWTRYPFAEVSGDLGELNEVIAMEWILKKQMTDSFKRGIASQSVPGLTINREPEVFEKLLSWYTKRKKELFGKLKPIKFIKYRGSTERTQVPGNIVNPLKVDKLVGEDYVDQRIEKLRSRG